VPYKDPEQTRECKRRYRERNRERLRAKGREYAKRRYREDPGHADYQRDLQRKRRLETPEKVREADRRSYVKHAAKRCEKSRRWREAHPDKVGEFRDRRRTQKLQVPYEPVRRLAVYKRDGGICHICGKDVDPSRFHVDHIVPLSRGGRHTYANVALAHPRCNYRKGARLLKEMAA
jgi:5-methylcytosine-specific restriction endonuclease McrA